MSHSPCHSFFKFFRQEPKENAVFDESFDSGNRLRDTSYDDDNFLKSYFKSQINKVDYDTLLKPKFKNRINLKKSQSLKNIPSTYKSIALDKKNNSHLHWRNQSNQSNNSQQSYSSLYRKKEHLPDAPNDKSSKVSYVKPSKSLMNIHVGSNSNNPSMSNKKHKIINTQGKVEQFDFSLYHIERRLHNFKIRDDFWNEHRIISEDYRSNEAQKEEEKESINNEPLNREQIIDNIIKKNDKICSNKKSEGSSPIKGVNVNNDNKGIKKHNRFIPKKIKVTSHNILSKSKWK